MADDLSSDRGPKADREIDWVCEGYDLPSSDPEFNEIQEALKKDKDLPYNDRILAVFDRIGKQVKEDLAFLESKYLEAQARVGKWSRRDLYWQHDLDVFDVRARRMLAAVPFPFPTPEYIKTLEKFVKDIECCVFKGKRAPDKFALQLRARVRYWEGVALKKVRELEREGVIRVLDASVDSERELIRKLPRLELECESVPSPPEQSQPEPAADNAGKYPKRAAWLKARRAERDFMTVGRIYELVKLDPKTTKRILDGKPVRETALQKLAKALGVDRDTIPDN